MSETTSTRAPQDPIVVLVDAGTWLSFLDVAAALRRHGVRVVRLTTRPRSRGGRFSQRLERLLFDGTVWLPEGWSAGERDLGALDGLEWENVVDVVVQDEMIPGLLTLGEAHLDQRFRVGPLVDPALLVDKRLQSDLAEAVGVGVPQLWELSDSAQLPVVVKTPVGSGGNGVRIVHERQVLAAAFDDLLSMDQGVPFLQQLAEGELLSFGGVADRGRVLMGATYERVPSPDDPTGPAESLVIREAPDVYASAHRFIEAVGLTGFVNLQFIVSDQGPLLIDVNPRVFGGWSMLQDLGYDVLGAYLALLGLGDLTPMAALVDGERADQVSMLVPADPDRRRVWRARTRASIRGRSQWLGWRWRIVMLAKVELLNARALVRDHTP